VVHRDVKPGNVFVLRNGRAKLGDFGIARMLADPAVFRTAGSQEAGTPAYFPPEISQGGAEPDARSDAYSFAVMAYETLTGQRPVLGDNPMAVIAAHWFAEIARPETIIPGFPAAAGDALLQGLLKDPAARLLPAQLVERLGAVPSDTWPAIRRFAGSSVPGGHPDSASTQQWVPVAEPASRPPTVRPRRRRRWIAIGAATALAAVLAVTLVAALRADPAAPALSVISAVVRISPTARSGRCPMAEFTFVARLETNGAAGTIASRWTLPGARRPPAQTTQVASGQHVVSIGARFRVTGQRALEGQAELQVESPTPIMASSPPIRYRC
jgi:serine/threonine-protein kinase